ALPIWNQVIHHVLNQSLALCLKSAVRVGQQDIANASDFVPILLDPVENELSGGRPWRCSARRMGRCLVPACRSSELAMDAISNISKEIQRGKCLPENLLRQDSPDNDRPAHVHIRHSRWIRRDPLGALKVVIIVAAPAT